LETVLLLQPIAPVQFAAKPSCMKGIDLYE